MFVAFNSWGTYVEFSVRAAEAGPNVGGSNSHFRNLSDCSLGGAARVRIDQAYHACDLGIPTRPRARTDTGAAERPASDAAPRGSGRWCDGEVLKDLSRTLSQNSLALFGILQQRHHTRFLARKLKTYFVWFSPHNSTRPQRASTVESHGHAFRQLSCVGNVNVSTGGGEIPHHAIDYR
jgi:hypothetical protein